MRLASSLAALAALTLLARADAPDPRTTLADQMAAELDTLAKTIAIVDGKLADSDAQRTRRARAAYRILRAPLPADATATDQMSDARRRAAARLLLERDRDERALLADELAQLHASETTLRAASSEVPTIELPTSLLAPAQGVVVRTFGTIVHERSKATLARRGIDIEVAQAAVVVAPADGVVRYAGPIRGLDSGVIVDHGTTLSVIGKLADVAIPVGTKVVRGDRLGHAARGRVYFELRVKVGPGGLPIDPEPLLTK